MPSNYSKSGGSEGDPTPLACRVHELPAASFCGGANGDKPNPPGAVRYAPCPYCLHAESSDPAVLILHSGYGTIYYPPVRNLTDTTLLIVGFIAAIRMARVTEAEAKATSPKFLTTISEARH